MKCEMVRHRLCILVAGNSVGTLAVWRGRPRVESPWQLLALQLPSGHTETHTCICPADFQGCLPGADGLGNLREMSPGDASEGGRIELNDGGGRATPMALKRLP